MPSSRVMPRAGKTVHEFPVLGWARLDGDCGFFLSFGLSSIPGLLVMTCGSLLMLSYACTGGTSEANFGIIRFLAGTYAERTMLYVQCRMEDRYMGTHFRIGML